MSTTLSRIDWASKRKTRTIEVPEGSITLKALSVGQLSSIKDGDNDNVVKLLSMTIVDEGGQQIYTTEEDLKNLSEMSVSTMKILSDAATELNKSEQATKAEA